MQEQYNFLTNPLQLQVPTAAEFDDVTPAKFDRILKIEIASAVCLTYWRNISYLIVIIIVNIIIWNPWKIPKVGQKLAINAESRQSTETKLSCNEIDLKRCNKTEII